MEQNPVSGDKTMKQRNKKPVGLDRPAKWFMPEFQGIISNLKTNFVVELIEENFFRTHRIVFNIPEL